jgi:hypothetical protein
MESHPYDRSGKWLIEHHGDSILRLAGIRRIVDWRPVPGEGVRPPSLLTRLQIHAIIRTSPPRGRDHAMQLTLDELHRFHRFAEEKLSNGGGDLTLEQMIDLWNIENPSSEQLQEDVLAVKAALRDLDNGDRGIPVEELIQKMRDKYGLPVE